MDDFKRVSVVDDMAVQAYITLRNAMSEMQGMYQEKADKIYDLIEAGVDVEDKAFFRGVAQTYAKVASDIGRFLNTKGGE